jgi:hypothetical protein
MNAPLSRVVLDVHDVERLSAFYQDAFALSVVEHIKSETSDLQNSGVPEFCHCQFAQVGNIRLAHSGVPEFWHFTWTQIRNIRFAWSSSRAGLWGACF